MARCLAVAAIIIWCLLLSPYPTSVFIAAVTAALTLPIYRWLRARMSKTSAIAFFSVGMVVCVATPITIVLVMVIPQALEGARRLSAWWQAGHPIPPAISYYAVEAQRIFVENVPNAPEYLDKLENDFNAVVNAVIKNILSRGLNLAGDTMGMVWAIFLFIVFTCLIVVYAPSIRRAVLQVLPHHEDMVERFVAVLHNASRSVFISIVFVPIIQGTLTGIGLRFLDVPDPAFWGLLAVFTAVIPLAGTAIVWLPISLYLWATQSLGAGLMLLAWGSIVVSGSDNLLRPYFLKTGIEVSMVVLLLSIVCSLAVFGAVGIIAGPVMVAMARQAMVESEHISRDRGDI
ncbi:AI-2E family transporter [Mailhella massiliensis]|uniref:AI-2E family transporter n=1 Tax=Mailhella massiliensis TaxID=1903261 RepID=UPI00097D14AC|nr:AI-2E family transporter [Mailhella massiliensis]